MSELNDILWRVGGVIIGVGWTLRDWSSTLRIYDERYSWGGSAWTGR